MLIHLAAETCNTTASLLGHRENQNVLLKIPSECYLANMNVTEITYVNNFVHVLAEYAIKAGILIMPLETRQARDLSEYLNKYHYKCAKVSCTLMPCAFRWSLTDLCYAKIGINYTICFQSAFLYAVSTLAL